MIFMFDDWNNETIYVECNNWAAAEQYAYEHGFDLIGEYVQLTPAQQWVPDNFTYEEVMQ